MDARAEALKIYENFVALHPNSVENFDPTLDNLQRWQWHIRQAAARPELDRMDYVQSTDARKVADGRAFKQFAQMPEYMREKYLQIAGVFPGIQFYACGSRVTGEYIETWSGAPIIKMRQALNKASKPESDYDVCIDMPVLNLTLAGIRANLPPWADLLNHGVPPDQKIAIPMWDFDRLPASEHANVIRLFRDQKWGELMAIHNRYVLSMNYYCCDERPIIRYFQWAIDNGKIKDESEPEKKADALAD